MNRRNSQIDAINISGGRMPGGSFEINTGEIKNVRLDLHKLELEEYIVEIPAMQSKGLTPAKLAEMALTMKELYSQIQTLINASEYMLSFIDNNVSCMDEALAKSL